jgi:RimJ/RimL family protein N-acetyltransferase
MHIARLARLRERVRDTLRYEGPLVLLWRILAKFFPPLGSVGIATLYEKDLTHPVVEVRAKADVTITEAGGSDIEQVVELVTRCERGSAEEVADVRREILERLRRGAKCFVAKAGDEIVHYNWLALRWAESLPIGSGGRFIILNDDEAFCMNAYTVTAWRGRGIHTAVLYKMLLWLRAVPIQRAYTVVGNENKSSWKTHERLGWSVRGTILYFKWRGMDRAWACGTRGVSSRFIAKDIPRLPRS